MCSVAGSGRVPCAANSGCCLRMATLPLLCRWWRGSAKLLKQLSGEPLQVAETVRQQLQDFQQHIPLIAALRNPGLRDRHWDKISAAVGVPVKADAGGFNLLDPCCSMVNYHW
eukprot:GHUV01045007.1.p1 GENE.GHUV01045007.1~~GHUV01045007.1.p1  ORF type:complete len:113 (-),score=27.32 GHUV01045007.1:33-371(-)